jgi:hypothetical protein
MVFVAKWFMFFTPPSREELDELDIDQLTDILTRQTNMYLELYRSEGMTALTLSQAQLVQDIQDAIEARKKVKHSEGI